MAVNEIVRVGTETRVGEGSRAFRNLEAGSVSAIAESPLHCVYAALATWL